MYWEAEKSSILSKQAVSTTATRDTMTQAHIQYHHGHVRSVAQMAHHEACDAGTDNVSTVTCDQWHN